MHTRRRALRLALAAALAGGAAAAQTPAPTPAGHELVFANVSVNGRDALFLVDTGAPTSLIDSAFAAQARLPLGEVQVLGGGGGLVAGRIADNIAIQAEGGPTLRLDPSVTDLAQIADVFGHRLDGILGGDYFGRLVVSLDYRAGRAIFKEPGSVTPPPGATRLRIVSTPFVHAAAQVGQRRAEGSFQIDTGSNTAVSFWAPVARRAFPEVRGTPAVSVGIGGESRSQMANLDRFEVAGRVLTNIPADFADNLHPNDSPADFAGVIGGPAFAGRVLTIDYARSLMWLD